MVTVEFFYYIVKKKTERNTKILMVKVSNWFLKDTLNAHHILIALDLTLTFSSHSTHYSWTICLIHLFNQHILLKCLPCAKHAARHWIHRRERDWPGPHPHWSLQEDRHLGRVLRTTEPTCVDHWSLWAPEFCTPKLEKPLHWETHTLQLEKTYAQNENPMQLKIN